MSGVESLSFRDLMARVRAGDEPAARELVRRYQPQLQRIIRVRLGDPRVRRTTGESDIFQSVMASFFVRASLGQYDLEQPDELIRLLSIMARNKIVDHARKKDVVRDSQSLDDAGEIAAGGSSPSQVVAIRELVGLAREKLTPEILELVALREAGMDWKQIAARTGEAPDAVRKRLTRAVDNLASELDLPRDTDGG